MFNITPTNAHKIDIYRGTKQPTGICFPVPTAGPAS